MDFLFTLFLLIILISICSLMIEKLLKQIINQLSMILDILFEIKRNL